MKGFTVLDFIQKVFHRNNCNFKNTKTVFMPNRWFEFYQDNQNKWRWKRWSPNNNIIGASSESFSSRAAAVNNARMNGYRGH